MNENSFDPTHENKISVHIYWLKKVFQGFERNVTRLLISGLSHC